MKTVIIYDSQYGNTEKVARTISKTLSQYGETTLELADQAHEADLANADLLVVGSPTQGGRPTEKVQHFIGGLKDNSLRGVKVAAFDTRFAEKSQNFSLRMLMKTIGYAAPKIARLLKSKGAYESQEPAGFIVKGKEGPLAEDELLRATQWAEKVAST